MSDKNLPPRESPIAKAWEDCRMRRGTSGSDDLMSIVRSYFIEGYSYGREEAEKDGDA